MTDPIRIRASSMAELGDCALRWEKKNLRGMTLPSSPPAAIGTAVHASTAAFDQSKLDGTGMSIDEAAGVAIDSLNNPDEEVDWAGVAIHKAEETALRVHLAYCTEIAPAQDYALVEHSVTPMIIEMENGVVFELTGTMDRIRHENGQYGVVDVKTGMSAVGADGVIAVGKHMGQLGVYTLLAENELTDPITLPAAIIGLSTGSQARVGFREVPGARESVIGTLDEPGLLHYYAPYFKTGLFPPNPQSWLCSEKFCPFFKSCRFHG